MRINFSNKSKVYWTNYFGYWLIFILVSIILGSINRIEDGPIFFNFKEGFVITSIISTFILAHMIARKYSGYNDIDKIRNNDEIK